MDEPPTAPSWFRCELVVEGPSGDVDAFSARARGPSAVPWHLDLDHEEIRIAALLAPSGHRGRVLARVLRSTQDARHERILAAVATPGGACPLDLNRLLPVPPAVLALGADAPASVAWMRENWGPGVPLRDVDVRDASDGRSRRRTRIAYRMSVADHPPTPAVAGMRAEWPTLAFHLSFTRSPAVG